MPAERLTTIDDPKPAKARKPGAAPSGRPTIKQIAEMAKVSVSTVSRALNNDLSISKATRRRIAALAEKIGFVPNVVARGLVTHRTNLVGIVLGASNNPFYLNMLPMLSRQLADRGIQTMLFHLDRGARFEDVVSALAQNQVQGCLVAAATLTPDAAAMCSRFRLPIVLINRLADVHVANVNCNNREAGEQVAAALIGEGRRKLAYVGGREGLISCQDADREQGFRERGASAGLKRITRFAAEYSYAGGVGVAEQILASDQSIDGVFAANDIMAFGVLDGLRRCNVSVPERISLIGFDDLQQASWHGYDLTTVQQPIDLMVSRACDLLAARVADPLMPPESVFMRGTLIRRGTTREVAEQP